MNLVEITQSLEEVVHKNDLAEVASILINQYAITKSDELQKTISDMEEDGRLLKIGIIGRVKAGKSSLLNALIFDGDDVLPKAATPMTAALTILEYGDDDKAYVEFFSDEDMQNIKQKSEQYEARLTKLKEQEYNKLKEIKLRKERKESLSADDKKEIEDKSINIALRELKADLTLSSVYDQYQRMKNSGVHYEELQNFQTITAASLEDLNKNLLEFVGSDGKYMPFTKAVTISTRQDSLKNFQIIDTPGVNDPVISREERTRKLLKNCDVVLVVSPSGQFLSSEDLDLMDRVTSKEGIKNLYIISSQIDNQLYGSEKKDTLNEAIKSITHKLTEQQNKILKEEQNSSPEIGGAYDSLMAKDVVTSSAVCFSLLKNFDDKSSWDENMNHVWENLNKNYKDFFFDDEIAKESLKKLANIESIKDIVSEIQNKKDDIANNKKADFLKAKQRSLSDYKQGLEQDINDQIKRVKDTDIDELKKQKASMEQFKLKAIDSANEVYMSLIDSLEIDIKDKLKSSINQHFKESKKDIRDSEGTTTENWTVKAEWWEFWKKDANYSREVITVKAGMIRDSITGLIDKIETATTDEAKKYINEWKKILTSKVVGEIRQVAGDDSLDILLISKVLRGVIESISFPEVSYADTFPVELKKSGTLKYYKAEEFMNIASSYVSELKPKVNNDIKRFTNQLVKILKQTNIGESIFSKYDGEIKQLIENIENKELSLERFNHILKQLGAIDVL